MPSGELVALVLQGGATVVLLLWVWDLRAQRREERAERIANAETMRTVGTALGELTSAIQDSLEGRATRQTRERR